MQRFYMQNWYGANDEYRSGNPTGFTNFGLGETINRLTLICMWALTAFCWTLSNIQQEAFFWFFTIWARILHYIDIFRLLTVTTFKIVGFFTDTK
jgi:hypothetical protein